MYLAFPADEKIKARLDAVCKSLNISLDQWFETALKASEFDVLVRFLGNSEDQTAWMLGSEKASEVRLRGSSLPKGTGIAPG